MCHWLSHKSVTFNFGSNCCFGNGRGDWRRRKICCSIKYIFGVEWLIVGLCSDGRGLRLIGGFCRSNLESYRLLTFFFILWNKVQTLQSLGQGNFPRHCHSINQIEFQVKQQIKTFRTLFTAPSKIKLIFIALNISRVVFLARHSVSH